MSGRSSVYAVALAGAALAALVAPDFAQAQNFAGKTVTLTIGYGPGSGNDIYGRLVARHLGKHIPGKPTVVAQNMPGAGSFKDAGFLYNAAPKDGTMLGYISQNAAVEELLGNPAVQFKTARFNWIGRIASYDNIIIFWHTSKIKTVADAMKEDATIGATGAGSAVYIYPNMMNKALGTRFKIVAGYQGTAQTSLAMERGEVEGVTMGWFPVKTGKQDWIKEKKISFLVQFLASRHPDLPDVPTIVELGRNDEEKHLFSLFANDGEIGKAVFLPPDVPAPVVVAYRKAFDDMVKDPEYIAETDKLQTEKDSMPGEKLQKIIEGVAATPRAVVERAKTLLK